MITRLLPIALAIVASCFLLGQTSAASRMKLQNSQTLLASLKLASTGQPVLFKLADQGWQIERDDEGVELKVVLVNREGDKWAQQRGQSVTLTYWPKEADAIKAVEPISEPRTWRGRAIPLQFLRHGNAIDMWMEGQWVGRITNPAQDTATIVALHAAEDELIPRDTDTQDVVALSNTWRWQSVQLVHAATRLDQWTQPRNSMTLAGVPFSYQPSQPALDLRQAKWINWQQDPGDYYEAYDSGPYMLHDPRMTVLRLPAEDLAAVHLLAAADDDPSLDDVVTLRVGRFGGANDRVVFHDFEVRVPRPCALPRDQASVEIQGRRYVPVRVPIGRAISQDLGGVMQIEITKKVRLAVRDPDPNRFRHRPLGKATGVRVAAITLEQPPVTMLVHSEETGHAFNEPQSPVFKIKLQNRTDRPLAGTLTGLATALDGKWVQHAVAYQLDADGASELQFNQPLPQRGYYDLQFTLNDDKGNTLLDRHTSAARLPPLAERRHRDRSPMGCWDFGGRHHTSDDADVIGSLYEKLGFRYGMFTSTAQERARWGVIKGSEPKITNRSSRQEPGASVGTYARTVQRHPDQLPVALIFHEAVISGVQAQRTPDLFHDRPPYVLNDSEEKRFDRMWADALAAATHMREHHPDVHLRLGNGLLTFKESFYARGFPKKLFDSGGNEAGSFSRPPETQPPDPVSFNASLWMDRQLLDAHGYHDTPVSQCYEIGCASTNPGNLSLRTQANYVTRMALLSMAWGMKEIRPGLISDVGNSYYYSHWGAAGYVNAYPELSVKPAFVSMATLTWVLDGATLINAGSADNPVVHDVLFKRANGDHVLALWTIRGSRDVILQLLPDQSAKWIDDQGRVTHLTPDAQHRVTVTIDDAPSYVRSTGNMSIASIGQPRYSLTPPARVLDALDHFEMWEVQKQRDLVLEYYNSFTPRMQGHFEFNVVSDALSDRQVWRVTPLAAPMSQGKATMPRYMAIHHRDGLPLPEDATGLSVWVNGNGSWGRVIYDLEDAAGQRWTSIGAPMTNPPAVWDHESLSPEFRETIRTIGINDWNSDDVKGLSRINHEGWRQIDFPLPGHYPGEGYHWPANSQWRHDKGGQVHLPLKLRQIIIELPPRTLTLKSFKPTPRLWIELRDLGTTTHRH